MTKKDVKRFLKIENNASNVRDNRNKVAVHGDKFRHFMVKSGLLKVLQENGHDVASEVEFDETGAIADVVDLSTGIVYEVETGLTQGDFEKKLDDFRMDYVKDVICLDPLEQPMDLGELKLKLEEVVVV